MSPINSVPSTAANTSEALHTQLLHLTLGGKRTEVAFHSLPSAHGTILLLHEALGSVSYWKHFPHHLAQSTGYNVIAYSRAGHGNSEGPLSERTNAFYLHQVNSVIPALLAHFAVTNPVLYGHSEGAGIAMLYTAQTSHVRALILESPFVISSPDAAELIHKMAAVYPNSKLQERLAHYHQHPDDVFNAWTSWASTLGNEVFPLRDFLPRIACPVLVLQGANDEFGTAMQLDALQQSIPHLQYEIYPETGHLPHREQTDRVLHRVSQFLSPTHLSNPRPLTGGSHV